MARDRARRPEAASLRLFVALEVPEQAREAIGAAFAPIRGRFPKARWVPPENQHVTLKFLGATWPRLSGWVIDTVAAVATSHHPVETRVSGVGAFPKPVRARVL